MSEHASASTPQHFDWVGGKAGSSEVVGLHRTSYLIECHDVGWSLVPRGMTEADVREEVVRRARFHRTAGWWRVSDGMYELLWMPDGAEGDDDADTAPEGRTP